MTIAQPGGRGYNSKPTLIDDDSFFIIQTHNPLVDVILIHYPLVDVISIHYPLVDVVSTATVTQLLKQPLVAARNHAAVASVMSRMRKSI